MSSNKYLLFFLIFTFFFACGESDVYETVDKLSYQYHFETGAYVEAGRNEIFLLYYSNMGVVRTCKELVALIEQDGWRLARQAGRFEMTTYIALFEYEQGARGFSVVFPDFPGLVTAGDTYEETLQMAHEALAGHIEILQDYGEQIPKPRTIELIQETWEEWNKWRDNYSFFVVPIAAFSQSKKSKAINIELDESLLERIDMVTSNRSEFINRALEYSLKG